MAALTENGGFERIYMISPQNDPVDEGLLFKLSRSELFSSVKDSRCLHIFPHDDKDP